MHRSKNITSIYSSVFPKYRRTHVLTTKNNGGLIKFVLVPIVLCYKYQAVCVLDRHFQWSQRTIFMIHQAYASNSIPKSRTGFYGHNMHFVRSCLALSNRGRIKLTNTGISTYPVMPSTVSSMGRTCILFPYLTSGQAWMLKEQLKLSRQSSSTIIYILMGNNPRRFGNYMYADFYDQNIQQLQFSLNK